MRAHELLERDGKHYAYCLTDRAVKVAILFVLFHQRLCNPLANCFPFSCRPDANHQPKSSIEAAVHRADVSIHSVIHMLQAF